jgi:hypothetical protein
MNLTSFIPVVCVLTNNNFGLPVRTQTMGGVFKYYFAARFWVAAVLCTHYVTNSFLRVFKN